MNGWTEFFLGVIAVATLATAIAQVAVVIAAGLVARRLTRLVDQVEREVQPVFGHVNAIARDAARAASLAATQVERADRVFADLAQRLEQTFNTIQTTLLTPARESRALLDGFRAALSTIRELRGRARGRQGRADDEDALFI